MINNTTNIPALLGNIFGTGGLFGGVDVVITGAVVVLIFMIIALRSNASLDFIFAFFAVLFTALTLYGYLPPWTVYIVAIGVGGVFALGVLEALTK